MHGHLEQVEMMMIQQTAMERNIDLPTRKDLLVTANGRVKLSMIQPCKEAGAPSTMRSNHLFLEGIPQTQPLDAILTPDLINSRVNVENLQKAATSAYLDMDHYRRHGSAHEKSALHLVASRYPTMLTGLGMGHHLAFNCDNHFARVAGEPLLKFSIPQRQVRHTVDCDKLLPEQDLDKVLTALVPTDTVI